VVHAAPNLRPVLVSYAHAGKQSDGAAEKFYNRLKDDLEGLVSPPPGTDVGFFDTRGLTAGVVWEPELADALGQSQVLGCLP
jgi:hypothetical protein